MNIYYVKTSKGIIDTDSSSDSSFEFLRAVKNLVLLLVLVFSEILDAFFELMEDVLFGNCGVNVATDGFMFLLLEDAVDFNGFELLSSFMLDVSGTLIEDIPLNDVEMMKEVPLT